VSEDDGITRRVALRGGAGVAGLLALTTVAGCSSDPARSDAAKTRADLSTAKASAAAASEDIATTQPPSSASRSPSGRPTRAAHSATQDKHAPEHAPERTPTSSAPTSTQHTSEPSHPPARTSTSRTSPPPATSSPPSTSPRPSPTPTSPSKPPPNALAKVSSIPVRGSIAATASGKPVTLARPSAGQVVGFSAICTHMGCTVAPAGTQLNCPCHGSVYNAFTGAVINGPAPQPLPPFAVRVVDGYVVPN
jgi:cytochrome b6-f complex iron-sulfur subunit